jgi:hypothetical protein
MHAEGAGQPEDAADRAVLAAGVGALQHDQHLEAAVGIEEVLQTVEVGGEGGHGRLVRGLVTEREGLLGGVEAAEIEGAPAPLVAGSLAGRCGRGLGVAVIGEAGPRSLRQVASVPGGIRSHAG